LYELDEQRTKFGYEITLIEEFNFGIPGGSNWLVQWYEKYNSSTRRPQIYTMIYIVDTDTKEIKFNYFIALSDDVSPYLFSYYQNLSGIVITDNICHIGDFNNDGFDEILRIGASYLIISGYDTQTNRIKKYCSIPYGDVDEGYNSPPVEFITYKGMDGFKVRFFVYEVAGGPGWVPDPDPRNRKWIFYTWDEGKREFVEVEEFVEDIEPSQPILAEQNTDEVKLVEDRGVQEEAAFTPADSEKKSGFNLYIVIISGIAALAAVVVFIVLKMKKK
jgi:hypothetical protein